MSGWCLLWTEWYWDSNSREGERECKREREREQRRKLREKERASKFPPFSYNLKYTESYFSNCKKPKPADCRKMCIPLHFHLLLLPPPNPPLLAEGHWWMLTYFGGCFGQSREGAPYWIYFPCLLLNITYDGRYWWGGLGHLCPLLIYSSNYSQSLIHWFMWQSWKLRNEVKYKILLWCCRC